MSTSYPPDAFFPPPLNDWSDQRNHTNNAYSNFTYTPIVIDFKAPLLNEDSSPFQDDLKPRQYVLNISTPPSNRRGETQHIPDTYYFRIPEDGIVRLQLVPSDRYLPIGRYKVDYYRIGKKNPLMTQNWVVPPPPPLGSYSFIYEPEMPVLPINIWKITSASAGDNWTAEYNSIFWTTPPVVGQLVTLRFQPAVTLDKLIEINPRNYKELNKHYA